MNHELSTQELEALRTLAQSNATELAVMKEILKRLDMSLFGLGNGEGGIINELTNKVNKHDKLIWIGTGFICAMQFLSGTGTISLKSFIGH